VTKLDELREANAAATAACDQAHAARQHRIRECGEIDARLAAVTVDSDMVAAVVDRERKKLLDAEIERLAAAYAQARQRAEQTQLAYQRACVDLERAHEWLGRLLGCADADLEVQLLSIGALRFQLQELRGRIYDLSGEVIELPAWPPVAEFELVS
jgi:hypothetical protein